MCPKFKQEFKLFLQETILLDEQISQPVLTFGKCPKLKQEFKLFLQEIILLD